MTTFPPTPDEFPVSGSDVRVRFSPGKPRNSETGTMLRVEQVTSDASGRWARTRVWNRDQADYGLNFTARPVLLKVRLGTYR